MKINPKYINKDIYERAYNKINLQFKGRPSAYRSAAVLKEYKKIGGKVDESKSSGGLRRWIQEEWKNLTPYAENLGSKIEFPCGKKHPKQKGASVCRPKKDVNKYNKKQIQKAIQIKNKGGIIFWGAL